MLQPPGFFLKPVEDERVFRQTDAKFWAGRDILTIRNPVFMTSGSSAKIIEVDDEGGAEPYGSETRVVDHTSTLTEVDHERDNFIRPSNPSSKITV